MNTLLIADAYDYFNLHKPAISYRFINDENPNGDISPNWSNLNWDEAFSYYYQPNLEYIVEVPFNKNNYNIKSIGNEFDVFDSTQLSRIKPTAALIISKNENNEIRMSIIEVLGCRDYYEMYGYDNINSYGSIDDNFKGIVSFYNAEGKPLSNYYIIDEKVHVIDSIWRTSPSSTAATARWGYFCFQEWENYWDASCPCFIAELVRVTCIDIGPTRIIGGPPGLVGGKRVITAPWNTGGSGVDQMMEVVMVQHICLI
ncbi:MAG: hypothetical protein IPJ43_08830 [Saprospiraceae bacterium]|nr:hypothetical protein [Saprospiraceae bacterium]